MNQPRKPRQPVGRHEFQIALICALPLEANAVEALFDGLWEEEHLIYGKAAGDPNAYTTGWIDSHNVVLAHMPGIGKANAAAVAASFRSSFPSINLALVVGICGGAPFGTNNEEILLGDIIISTGVVQFDFARRYPDKVSTRDILEGNLGFFGAELRSFVNRLSSRRIRQQLTERAWMYLQELQLEDDLGASYPGSGKDKLFEPKYRHKHHRSQDDCSVCFQCNTLNDDVCNTSRKMNCDVIGCSDDYLVPRERLRESIVPAFQNLAEMPRSLRPAVHFGLVASGDLVMKCGHHRDNISAQHEVIAFEMEAAGTWNTLPTIVIKGVCDYADSHKNKSWQTYCAASAAAYLKSLLWQWRVPDSRQTLAESIALGKSKPQEMEEEAKKAEEKEYQDCLRSLHFPSIFSREETIADRAPNTFDWIWHPQNGFASWLHEGHDMFWITGKPGSGKSTLLKHILHTKEKLALHLSKECGDSGIDSEKPIIVSYFFYFYGDTLSRSLEGMLRSFLWQLLKIRQSLFTRFRPMYSDMILFQSSLEWNIPNLLKSLEFVLRNLSGNPVLFVVDALDEFSGTDREIAEFFDQLSKSTSVEAKFLLSSRPYPDFSYEFDGLMKLEMHKNTFVDVSEYIQQRFSRLRARQIAELDKLTKAIMDRAEGNFFWVKLVCDDLQRGWTRYESFQQLWEKLNRLPSELSMFYGRIMDEMDEYDREQALKMLQVISCAPRSLHVIELCFILEFSTGDIRLQPFFDTTPLASFGKPPNFLPAGVEGSFEDNCEILAKRVDAICRGLAHVSDDYVQLSHETVSTFIRNRNFGHNSLGHTFNGHSTLLKACVAYLESIFSNCSQLEWWTEKTTVYYQFSDKLWDSCRETGEVPKLLLNDAEFSPGASAYVPSEDVWNRENRFPLLDYSITNWLRHAKECQAATGQSFVESFGILSEHTMKVWYVCDDKVQRIVHSQTNSVSESAAEKFFAATAMASFGDLAI